MKTTFKFIIAALSAIAVFSSCQKELTKEIATNTTDGLRVITVQFDNPTKASLGTDGLTPKFANGDKIRVSNDTESKECEISISGDVATFTTDLTGNLTAIYPAAAAVYTGTGPITDPFFIVKESQDGDIAKAIIAKAVITDASSCATATFRCQTALFQITPPSGVTTFKIKSLNTIDASTGQRSTAANAVAINTEGADEAARREIAVNVPSGGTAYVALKYGVKLSDLSFEYITNATNGLGAMKGIPTNEIKTLASSSGITFDQANATAANTKYTIKEDKWHPYVTIGGKRWATENIGVTASDPNGIYFAWGYTEGCVRNSDYDGWVLAKDRTTQMQFNTSTFENKIASTFEDAAYANWGGDWRMPTSDEFFNLLMNEFSEWTDNYNSTNIGGLIVWKALGSDASYYKPSTYAELINEMCRQMKADGSTGNSVVPHTVNTGYNISTTPHIFFPAAGLGNNSLLNTTSNYFWSSTFDSSGKARVLHFQKKNTGDDLTTKTTCVQYIGTPIRPVSN